MTLWGCRLGTGFEQCASASYTLPHIIIVGVVAGAVAAVLFYYTGRLLSQFLR